MRVASMLKVVILISGRGSNMQAILAANLPIEVVAVISNRADALGLQVAAEKNIPTAVLSAQSFRSRAEYDAALLNLIDTYTPNLVVLAGFMRILTADFVNHYAGRLINIHPSLLPSFTGLDTHQRAIDAGVKVHGCSVHFVIAELDAGPLIAQAVVNVQENDDEAALAARVLAQEHQLYPEVVRWFAEKRVQCVDGKVQIQGAQKQEIALRLPVIASLS